MLYSRYKLPIVFVGSQQESKLADSIITTSKLTSHCKNYMKDSLLDLITIISKSSLLLSNDTAAIHISAACDVPFICIANGYHANRFSAYPSSVFSKCMTIFPDASKQNKQPEHKVNLPHIESILPDDAFLI